MDEFKDVDVKDIYSFEEVSFPEELDTEAAVELVKEYIIKIENVQEDFQIATDYIGSVLYKKIKNINDIIKAVPLEDVFIDLLKSTSFEVFESALRCIGLIIYANKKSFDSFAQKDLFLIIANNFNNITEIEANLQYKIIAIISNIIYNSVFSLAEFANHIIDEGLFDKLICYLDDIISDFEDKEDGFEELAKESVIEAIQIIVENKDLFAIENIAAILSIIIKIFTNHHSSIYRQGSQIFYNFYMLHPDLFPLDIEKNPFIPIIDLIENEVDNILDGGLENISSLLRLIHDCIFIDDLAEDKIEPEIKNFRIAHTEWLIERIDHESLFSAIMDIKSIIVEEKCETAVEAFRLLAIMQEVTNEAMGATDVCELHEMASIMAEDVLCETRNAFASYYFSAPSMYRIGFFETEFNPGVLLELLSGTETSELKGVIGGIRTLLEREGADTGTEGYKEFMQIYVPPFLEDMLGTTQFDGIIEDMLTTLAPFIESS